MKINLTTLGCPKNIVDSEILLGGLQGVDVEFVDDPEEAETIILNTCGFIQGAKEESIDAILQALELKKNGGCKRVFVTGCLSQRYPDALLQEMPEVDGFYGNRDLKKIIQNLAQRLDLRREILGDRVLTTPRHYAYLKISEGCENPCTFCSIPGIRGKFRSRPFEELVDEAQMLAGNGVRELILVAQDTTIYGQDLYGEKKLVQLIDRLTGIRQFKWIRLLYTYPAHFGDDLIEIIADKREVLNYVDMPIQHISNELLKKMARKVDRRKIEHIVNKLRSLSTGLAIRSTFIVGFPGETAVHHEELCHFLNEIRFERLGLFAFSREEDTPAYHFANQVEDHVVQERLAELNDLQHEVSLEFNELQRNTIQPVIIEQYDTDSATYVGRTTYDCPEIDNTVVVEGQGLTIGEFYAVRISECGAFELRGDVVDSSISETNIFSKRGQS